MLTTGRAVETVRGDRVAANLRGFGPLGVAVALIVIALGPLIEPFNALAVPLWVWLSGTPWRDLGCAKPRSWAATVGGGVAFGVTFKLAMKAIVMPLLGAPAVNPALHHLVGHTLALPGTTLALIVGAGWGEESVFRGFLFERLRKLLGSGTSALATMVLVSGALFGALHYPVQGLAGAEQATIFGLVFGTVFAITDGLWFLVAAHAAFDLTAMLIIYANAEASVAHLFFR